MILAEAKEFGTKHCYCLHLRGHLQPLINRSYIQRAIEKSAAVFESIIINHPFTDGNKRTAYFLLRLILLEHNLDIIATEDEKYNMTIAASKGEIRIEEIKVWIKEHFTTRYQ